MCVAVEIVAPTNATGDFGNDQLIGGSIANLVNPGDTAFVRLGPSIVGWNGRLIQQMFMIEPNITSLPREIQFQVTVNGVSTMDSFEIVAPYDVGTLSGGGVIPGISRTKRNTMVVDSLILLNGTYTFPTTDPDPSTPGNQGYLPLRILSKGPIRLSNASIIASGASGITGSGGGNGGPGGGGGGSGFPGKGGDGYTGGGGDNDNANGPGGVGSGTTSGSNPWDGGLSLNGAPGGSGEQHSGNSNDDGAGGGTGLPFGTSGNVGGGSASPAGGYGGASAGGSNSSYTTDYGGGGGGFETSGAGGGGTGNNGGQVNGNSMLVPLSGGSGGGAGNSTYSSLFSPNTKGGPGGGGGGAIELTSFSSFSHNGGTGILASGGAGGNANNSTFPASGGGGGSGGAVSISARDSIVIATGVSISEAGGGGGSGQNSGGSGGVGRARLNGMVSKFASPSGANFFTSAKDFVGPSVQHVTSTPDSVFVHGYAEQWDGVPSSPLPVGVYYSWPSNTTWSEILVTPTADLRSHTAQWNVAFPNSANPRDSEVYVVAVQFTSGNSTTYAVIPSAVMSHTSGIIAKVVGPPKMLVKVTNIDFGNVRVDSCSRDTTIEIYSVGRSDLIVDSVALNPAIADYKIKTAFPDTVHIGDSLKLTLSFCPAAMKCPIAANLVIYSNAGDSTVGLTGCGVQPHALLHPLVINFGRVHIGQCKDTFAYIIDTGTSALTITRESLGDLVHFKILDVMPITIAAHDSALIHLEFCPGDTSTVTTTDTILSNAPESPSLLTLIGSGKIGVLSLPAVLDFGLVHLGNCKDSGFYAVNTGNDSLLVTSASIVGSNNFTLISPPTPFVLQADSSVFVTIRYCAMDTGTAQAFLGTRTDLPDSQTVILLGHTGIGILSIPDTIDFGAVPTGACVDTNVLIANVGTDTLFLAGDTNIAPPFYYVGPSSLRLAPGMQSTITLRFCPLDTNAASETTELDTIGPAINHTFTLIGKGIEGALSTSGAIDVGCIAVGTSVTKTVTIHNTGTAALDSLTATIAPNGVASIVHNPPSLLAAGAGDSVVIVIPASSIGPISATLSIAWRGGKPVTLPITGTVTAPPAITSLDSLVTFDTTNVGDSSVIKCISITNYSCIPVAIDSAVIVGGLNGEFEIVSNTSGASLSDSAIAVICLRYTPRRGGPASAELKIASGKDTISVAALTGVGVGKSVGVELAVDTVAGRPGEIVNVPVRTLNDITSAAITSITFRVTFNPMQLDLKSPVAPITLSIIPSSNAHSAHSLSTTATYLVKTYSIGDKEITATYSSPLTGTPVLAELPFEILEPTANTAPVHILSASFGTSPATLSTTSDGLIQIEQCDTNNRVIYTPAAIAVAQNNPNPFSRATAVTVDVLTAGHLTLEVYNALGMKVLVPFDADVAVGTQLIEIDASRLPSGAYRYITTWTGPASPVRIEKTMVVLGE